MRVLPLSLLSLTLFTSAVSAHESCDAPTAAVNLSFDQMLNLEGAYRLTDGRILNMSSQSGKLYAKVSNRRRVAVEATAPNKLVSVDRTLEITFDPASSAEPLKLMN